MNVSKWVFVVKFVRSSAQKEMVRKTTSRNRSAKLDCRNADLIRRAPRLHELRAALGRLRGTHLQAARTPSCAEVVSVERHLHVEDP